MKKITELDVKKKKPDQVLVDLNDPEVVAWLERVEAASRKAEESFTRLIDDFKSRHEDK